MKKGKVNIAGKGKKSLAAMGMALAVVAGLAGCAGHQHGEEGHDHEAETHAEAAKDAHGDDIVMSHEAVEKSGIVLAEVTPGTFREAVKAQGVIESSRQGERIITAPAGGIITFHGNAVDGAAVKAGQLLFTVTSRDTEQGDAQAAVNTDLQLARQEYERAEKLVKDGLISRKEYDSAKAAYERTKAVADGVAARSRNGMGITAPISGFMIQVNVRPGQFVNMGDPLAVVTADRRIMLRAELSERHRDFVNRISGANIRVPGAESAVDLSPGSSLAPRVLTRGSVNTEASHYLPIYIEFDNPGALGSGAVVEAWLLGNERQGVITVPKSALVEDNGYYYVYVKEDEHDHDKKAGHDEGEDGEEEEDDDHFVFNKREVKIGGFDGSQVEIISGLEDGETIATEGALKIKMAGMGSAIQGHSHHH